MRRVPAALWISAPLVVGVLYALAHGLLAPTPTVEDVVPEDAVLSHRFRDLAAVERSFPWTLSQIYGTLPERAPDEGAPLLEDIARARNVPGLPGVDRRAPFHWVLLPREGRPDSTMAIFSLSEPAEFRERFDDPDYLFERGFYRRAQNLEVRGRFGAVAWDRDAVRRIGGGGITAPDLGEDHVLSLRVPETVDTALLTPTEAPWRALLEALGFAAQAPTVPVDPGTGRPSRALAVPAGRVWRVRESWETCRLWSWLDEGRVRIDLESARDPEATPDAAPGGLPDSAPPQARAWLRVPSRAAFVRTVEVLRDLGVAFPDALLSGSSAWTAEGAGGPLLVWAERSSAHAHAWSLGLIAPRGGLPDLSPVLKAIPAPMRDLAVGAIRAPLAEGEAPLLVYDAGAGKPSPAGEVVVTTTAPHDVVTVGAEAAAMETSARAWAASGGSWTPPPPPEPGWTLLASFFLDEPRAAKALGRWIEPRSLLGALGGGDVSGDVWARGRTVRIEARAARRP